MSEKVSRRRWIEIVGGTITGLVVGAVAGYFSGAAPAPTVTVTSTKEVTKTVTVTSPPSPTPTPTPPAKIPVKFAVVLPYSIYDASWNFKGYEALMNVKREFPEIDTSYSEYVIYADGERVAKDYAAKGYNLICLHGSGYETSVFKAAEAYPDANFLWGSGWDTASNVASYAWLVYEGYYLAGMLAGGMTQSNKIGFISAAQFADSIAVYNAYRAGAESVNPNVEVLDTWTGSWQDITKGKEAALAQAELGADAIATAGDGLSLGVIEGAREANAWTFGYLGDQYALAPGNILTSVLWNISPYFRYFVERVQTDTFKGEILRWGMSKGVVDIAPYHTDIVKKIPADLRDRVARTREDIIAGRFEVPYITEMPT